MDVDKCTLLIRHLPLDVSHENVVELLKTFGAVRVRTMAAKYGKMQQIAFATFDNPTAAESALQRLHQLEVSGSRLVVVYALNGQMPDDDVGAKDDRPTPVVQKLEQPADYSKNIGLVAEMLGLNYPFSPRLRYCYPAPNPGTVHNIATALVSVPKFYWQVLHLMNKMNLPAPFQTAAPSAQMPPSFDFLWQFAPPSQTVGPTSSGEESEMESDHETEGSAAPVMAPVKRRRTGAASKVSKRSRISSMLAKPAVTDAAAAQPSVPPADVFELANPQSAKRIEFKISAEALADKKVKEEAERSATAAAAVDAGSFGSFAADPAAMADSETALFVTDRELQSSRVSSQGMSILPVFKNYQCGKASARLYIKNLAKQVEEKDLRFVYGRYVHHLLDDEKETFDIRLLKEGRMKGQAFVTFPDVALATSALADTNGYMLHGKPIVVQYAHQSKAETRPP